MATVTPSLHLTTGKRVPYILWETVKTGDTINSFEVDGQHGLAGSVQIAGTFDSATVKLQRSNDGTNWFDAKDVFGATVSTTSAAIFEVSISSAYLRVASSGGGGSDDIDVIVILRG